MTTTHLQALRASTDETNALIRALIERVQFLDATVTNQQTQIDVLHQLINIDQRQPRPSRRRVA